jgi:hypothetical protein
MIGAEKMTDRLHIKDDWRANADESDINSILIDTSDYITTNGTFYIIDANMNMVEWHLVDVDRVIEDLQRFRQMLVDAGRLPEQRPRGD